eukprot:COSAG01_NODE_32663_length_577_cov_3.081590_1_plen_79_part_10
MGRGGRPRLDRCAVLGGARLQHRLRLQHGLWRRRGPQLQLEDPDAAGLKIAKPLWIAIVGFFVCGLVTVFFPFKVGRVL